VTSRKSKAAAAALVVGLSALAGLNAARHSGGHETLVQQFQHRSLVQFPSDITYRTGECPAYRGQGFACWAPIARTVYFSGRPDYSTFLHESCHAWQTDHANDAASKQMIKLILGYPPRTRFDWAIGEVLRDSKRVPPIEAFADGCEQCARGRRVADLGYGRSLSLQRWKGLCKFIRSRA